MRYKTDFHWWNIQIIAFTPVVEVQSVLDRLIMHTSIGGNRSIRYIFLSKLSSKAVTYEGGGLTMAIVT
jgi:hypothetical protein